MDRILTCEEVRDAERLADEAGTSLRTLMANAGAACASFIDQRFPRGRIVVLCGPGNNGGDGLVAAERLARAKRVVEVFELTGETPSEERKWATSQWAGRRRLLTELELQPGDVVVDALFGAGLSRPLDGDARSAIETVATSECAVVAIDLPSGVNGDRSAPLCPVARADATITFGARKPAHVLQPAASACGEVVVAPIGFEDQLDAAQPNRTLHNHPELWAKALRWPDVTAHKHARGRLSVVSGGAATTGAARLAAQAGLRVGAGLVTVHCPPDALAVVAPSLLAVMCGSFEGASELVTATERSHAVVLGPAAGVTEETERNVEALAGAGRRLVLDADALSVFAGRAEALGAALKAETVLTPHVGEFERLFPGELKGALNRIEAVRAAAQRVGATILLKGPDTVIAGPDGGVVVNTHATPFLATAGSGDVLAGVIGGLMAQGLDAMDAAAAAAWMHGDAGLRLGAGMTAEDLDGALRQVLAELFSGQSGR